MRILKGYSKRERKELEEAKDNNFDNAIDLIRGIAIDDDDCTSLNNKYMNECSEEDNQMAKDIIDFYTGNAKFAEKKYVVHDTTDHYIYYDELLDNLRWSQPLRMPEKKTKDEWLAINPAYEPMLEEVED